MTTAEQRAYTLEEYRLTEEGSQEKHEFFRGVIYAMPGGSPRHALLVGCVMAQLSEQFSAGPCRVFGSDLRLVAEKVEHWTYADASVVCGALERDEAKLAVRNPRILVEVLSPSTQAYDRGEKAAHYQTIASLESLILVDPAGFIEVSTRMETPTVLSTGELQHFAWWEFSGGRHELLPGFWLDVDRLFREAEGV